MADPTLTNIQILRSPVPHKRPDPNLMLDGQLAINYKAVDPGLFTKTVEGTLIKFGPTSITNDGLWPNHSTKQDPDGLAGNSHGESWLDGRSAYWSPIEKVYDADKDEWVTTNGFTVDDTNGNFTLMKWLTVDRLYANYVSVDGQLDVNGNFLPSGTNCIHDVGSASNRWRGIYSCLMDTTGNLTVGGDVDISGFTQIGGFLSVDGNADILGTVTIGTTPTSGDTLKVNSPATFDSTMVIVDDTTAKGLTLSSFLTVKGNVEIGDGCGVTTLHVYSETTFHCDVEFVKQPLTVDYLDVKILLKSEGDTILGTTCGNDNLTVNAESLFNCLTEHEGELRVGRISGANLRAYGGLFVVADSQFDQNVRVLGKVRSDHTLNSDLEDTLTTKSWVKDWVASEAGRLSYWQRTGVALSPINSGDSIFPNGTGGTLGAPGARWDSLYSTSLNLSGKGVSASTVDSDVPTTLVTKDWVESRIDFAGYWRKIGNDLSPKISGGNVVPHGNTDFGTTGNRWTNGYFNNVYTNDLHLKNDRGDWTLIEEEEVLTLRNNKTGKRYAISMTPYEG